MANHIAQIPINKSSEVSRYDYGQSIEQKQDIFLQFIPGRVIEVATNKSSKLYKL